MLRRLIESFAREIRMMRLAGALAKSDDAAFARDTAMLEAVRRQRVAEVVCPLGDCNSCRPEPLPLDLVAEEERSLELSHAVGWLIEHWPDVWYFDTGGKPLRDVAGDLIDLRARVESGRCSR